jgi:hypothetical protein
VGHGTSAREEPPRFEQMCGTRYQARRAAQEHVQTRHYLAARAAAFYLAVTIFAGRANIFDHRVRFVCT